MSQDVQELVQFSELYQELLESAFDQAIEKVGDLGLPRPAFEVRVFRVLEPRFGRERLTGRKRDAGVAAAIRKLQAPDLYLAVAVGESLPEAVKRCRDWYEEGVLEAARVVSGSRAQAEGLCRNLWDALLRVMPPPAPAPLIAAYDGRPSLKGWLRVVTQRTGRDAGMRGPKVKTRTELAEAEQALLASGERQALDSCLAGVMARESTQDRLLFALTEIEVLSAAESAHLVDSDPRRVDERLRRLRKRLRQAMERTLQKELGYDARGIEDYWKRARRVVAT